MKSGVFLAGVSAIWFLFGEGGSAAAQSDPGVEAPSSFQRSISDRADGFGEEEAIDAAAAQAQAAEAAGGPVSGLDRRAATRVEEIVVSARKRQEAFDLFIEALETQDPGVSAKAQEAFKASNALAQNLSAAP